MTQEQKRIITILIPLVGSHVTGEMLENAVNEICKPSGLQRGITITNIGRPSEELVDSIGNIARKFADFIIDEYIDDAAFYDLWSEFLDHNHDIYTEIAALIPSSPSGENGDNFISKETMFDFVRWLREDDRFNGGQSLKMVFDKFINTENQNK